MLAHACLQVLPKLAELHLRETGASADGGLRALGDMLLPKTGGLPSLRALVVDLSHLEHPRLKEAYEARTGHGGIHACKMMCDLSPERAKAAASSAIMARSDATTPAERARARE